MDTPMHIIIAEAPTQCEIMYAYNFILLLSRVQFLSNSVKGVVELSPSGVAPVCRVGDQLELTCTSSGAVHRWEFTFFPDNITLTPTLVTSVGTSGVSQTLTFSSFTITFSKLSGQNLLPLVSGTVVSPVSGGLNGTVVNCFEGISSTNSVATTTIRIIDPSQFGLSVQSDPEQFSRDGVTVNLEWTLLNSQDYYQQFLQNVIVNVDPPPDNIMCTGNMRVQLTLSYNTLYNVSVTQNSTCERLYRTTFLELNYIKCADPMELTNARAVGYVDPALEGQNITFTCAPGQTLSGSNSSTCMGNGKWEPDPRDVECIPGTDTGPNTQATAVYPTSATISASCSSPSYILRISDPVRIIKESPRQEFDDTDCCSGFLIISANNTICLENGEWELDTSQMNEGMVAMLRIALISVTCVLVISVFTFIAGIACYHYISQRWSASADTNKQPESHNNPKDTESELEM